MFRQIEKLIGIDIAVASGDVPPMSAAKSAKRGKNGKSGRSGKPQFNKSAGAGDNDNGRRFAKNRRRRPQARKSAA